jgi:hypothetical protein
MFRSSFAAGAIALMAVAPAFAQSPTGNGMQNGTMSNGNPPTGGNMATMTCDQMLAKEQEQSGNGTGAKLTVAQNETSMANRARAAGDEVGCKMHAQNALNALK